MKNAFFYIAVLGMLIYGTEKSAFAQTNTTPNLSGYFVNVDGKPNGPHGTSGLTQLINQGLLNRDTLVWKDGLTNWAPAVTFAELSPLFSGLPPPIPVTSSAEASSQTPPPIPSQMEESTNYENERTWYNSYADAFDRTKMFMNLGVGLGPNRGYSMGIPPISASFDFKVSQTVPITVGITGMFSTWHWKYSLAYSSADITYTNIGIAGRGMYHFNFTNKLDTYTGLTLGYVFQSASGSANQPITGNSFFLWGWCIGIRYAFSGSVGIYSELGYSGLQYLSAVLTFRRK